MSYDTTSTNLLTLNNEPFPTSTQQPSSSAPDSKQISKLILRSALQKANAAVQCDSTNDVLGAINAYKEAILLLERVLATVDKENDRKRLQEIHDSYSERIRLLSTITSKLESDMLFHQPSNKTEDEGVEKSWLSSKPTVRSSSRPISNKHNNHTSIIRKMTSASSIDSGITPAAAVVRNWQDNVSSPSSSSSSSSVRFVSQKEKLSKLPVSPPPPVPLPPAPILQMQTSKSTPTKHSNSNTTTKYEEFDLEKDELNLLGQHEPMVPTSVVTRPPRHRSRITTSNRSSVSSIESSTSSIESFSENSSILEQPAMALPSLKKQQQQQQQEDGDDNNDTPIPAKKSVFRARTSSLPKSSPSIQRSSSMSTVETLLVDNNEETVTSVEKTTPVPPPSLVINRPIISRPSVGGSLGSMRKKAANRLSMDGFVNRNKTNSATPTSGPIYGLFLKDQIQPAGDMDYMMDNNGSVHPTQSQQQQEDDDSDIIEDLTGGHLKLLMALEKSMLEGAHITQKLYIPKNLWQQPNIRLSSMDIKVSACESLMNDIARLENWTYLDDLVSSTRLLDNFENSVDHLQTSLSKKLKRESHVESNSNSNNSNSPSSASSVISGSQIGSSSMIHSNSRDSMSTIGRIDSGKKTQSFMSWGTKLTKSVERMNAFSLTKTEDQYRHYIEVLQKLFLKIHILENWLNHYSIEKRKSRQPQHDVLIMKLIKICTVINTVVGGFVVRDITILLAKWLKRGGSWVNE